MVSSLIGHIMFHSKSSSKTSVCFDLTCHHLFPSSIPIFHLCVLIIPFTRILFPSLSIYYHQTVRPWACFVPENISDFELSSQSPQRYLGLPRQQFPLDCRLSATMFPLRSPGHSPRKLSTQQWPGIWIKWGPQRSGWCIHSGSMWISAYWDIGGVTVRKWGLALDLYNRWVRLFVIVQSQGMRCNECRGLCDKCSAEH